MSASDYLEAAWLNTLKNTSFSVAACWVKLHVGDPGEAGTSNAAGETTRKQVTWGTVSGNTLSSSGTLSWTNMAATETITHISFWDASTNGNCLGGGSLAQSVSVTATGGLDLTSVTWTVD